MNTQKHRWQSYGLLLGVLVVSLFLGHAQSAHAATLGGNDYFTKVYWFNGGYIDWTNQAKDANQNDVLISGINNQYGLYGMNTPVGKMHFLMGNWGTGVGQVAYEYMNTSGGWTALSVTKDATNNFTQPTIDGIANVEFAMPNNWNKQTVNGVSAYWIRIKLLVPYGATNPRATQVRGTGYNVKTFVTKKDNSAWITSLTPVLENCASAQFPNGEYWGEWNAGAGVHYYALRMDGGSCNLNFKGLDSLGYVPDTVLSLTALTNNLKDFTGTAINMVPTGLVTVMDEDGDIMQSAGVLFNGKAQTYTGTNNDGKYYFASTENVTKPLSISNVGYVTKNFAAVAFFPTVNTSITLQGTGVCPDPVAPGSAVTCQALQKNTKLTINGANGALSGANVSIYEDAEKTNLAPDYSKLQGIGKADGPTNASGVFTAALDAKKLFYKVTASGYTDAVGELTVMGGQLNTLTITMMQSQIPPPPPPPPDNTVSLSMSTVSANPSAVTADGSSISTVTVTIKNAAGQLLSGKVVSLSSSMAGVTLSPASATTDGNGVATFSAKSSTVGTTTLSAMVDAATLQQTASVQFLAPGVPPPPPPVNCPFTVGSLYKLPSDNNPATQFDTAVYFYGKDCKRHAFSNDKVFFTWYSNFSGVQTVSSQTLASMTLGKNITYRPGIKMIKFQTLNKVYVVSKFGVLRWLSTEAAAIGLYGSDWNKKIDDVSDAFFTDYTFGSDVVNVSDYNVSAEQAGALTINDNM